MFKWKRKWELSAEIQRNQCMVDNEKLLNLYRKGMYNDLLVQLNAAEANVSKQIESVKESTSSTEEDINNLKHYLEDIQKTIENLQERKTIALADSKSKFSKLHAKRRTLSNYDNLITEYLKKKNITELVRLTTEMRYLIDAAKEKRNIKKLQDQINGVDGGFKDDTDSELSNPSMSRSTESDRPVASDLTDEESQEFELDKDHEARCAPRTKG